MLSERRLLNGANYYQEFSLGCRCQSNLKFSWKENIWKGSRVASSQDKWCSITFFRNFLPASNGMTLNFIETENDCRGIWSRQMSLKSANVGAIQTWGLFYKHLSLGSQRKPRKYGKKYSSIYYYVASALIRRKKDWSTWDDFVLEKVWVIVRYIFGLNHFDKLYSNLKLFWIVPFISNN